MSMKLGVPRECRAGERRVAAGEFIGNLDEIGTRDRDVIGERALSIDADLLSVSAIVATLSVACAAFAAVDRRNEDDPAAAVGTAGDAARRFVAEHGPRLATAVVAEECVQVGPAYPAGVDLDESLAGRELGMNPASFLLDIAAEHERNRGEA